MLTLHLYNQTRWILNIAKLLKTLLISGSQETNRKWGNWGTDGGNFTALTHCWGRLAAPRPGGGSMPSRCPSLLVFACPDCKISPLGLLLAWAGRCGGMLGDTGTGHYFELPGVRQRHPQPQLPISIALLVTGKHRKGWLGAQGTHIGDCRAC